MLQKLLAAITNPLKANDIKELVLNIAEFARNIGLPIAIIFIVYNGFLFVSARGDEKKLETAKEGIKWSLIGAALIVVASFLAEAVVNFVKEF